MKYNDLYESKKHGTYGFPIEYYHVTELHPQYEMPLHRHKEFEIIRVLNGSLKLFLNGIEYSLTMCDIAFVNCSVLHRAEPDSCVYECLVADLNMLKKISDDISTMILPIINEKAYVNVILKQDSSLLYSTAVSLFSKMRDENECYKLEVVSIYLKLFAELYKAEFVSTEKFRLPKTHTEAITAVLDYIEENLCEHLNLSLLSQKAGFNEKYFCRVFKASTGRTPIEYINELRINNACRLLTHENKTVTEAGLLSGFSDMSYFSKVFKAQKHCTPREWKQKYEK